jgi:hypothetical protein
MEGRGNSGEFIRGCGAALGITQAALPDLHRTLEQLIAPGVFLALAACANLKGLQAFAAACGNVFALAMAATGVVSGAGQL